MLPLVLLSDNLERLPQERTLVLLPLGRERTTGESLRLFELQNVVTIDYTLAKRRPLAPFWPWPETGMLQNCLLARADSQLTGNKSIRAPNFSRTEYMF